MNAIESNKTDHPSNTEVDIKTNSPERMDDVGEDETQLLADTPAPSPPSSPPNEGAMEVDPATLSTPPSADAIAERVQELFGKRRAMDNEGTGVPKVVSADSAEADANAQIEVETNNDSSESKNDSQVNTPEPIKGNSDVGDKVKGNSDVGDNSTVVNMDVAEDNATPVASGNNEEANDANDGWDEPEVDQPQAFPDQAFPVAVPGYPIHPVFDYRYRAGTDSTPRRRRIDFDRAIVLPQCRRDPHTNRISNEDYEAREDSEMQLSLG